MALGHRGGGHSRTGCFGECYEAVGDVAETIALLLPDPAGFERQAAALLGGNGGLLPLREWDEPEQRDSLLWAWREMDDAQRFVWNKLITGEFESAYRSSW